MADGSVLVCEVAGGTIARVLDAALLRRIEPRLFGDLPAGEG
jgi:hypothetical protein